MALLILATELQATGLRVLFIGDSITDGNWGKGDGKPSAQRPQWDMNHIFGSGYMYLCATHYMGKYPRREYMFFNRGSSGNTLDDLEKRWDTDVLEMQPDVLSVLIGINDVNRYLHGDRKTPFDFDAWEATYRKLLDHARQANPNLKIVLAGPFVAPTGKMSSDAGFAQCNEITRRCDGIVKKIAQDYHALYLPYQEMFDQILKSEPTSQDTYWIWDGVHPTPAGHWLMANMWIKQVDKKKFLK